MISPTKFLFLAALIAVAFAHDAAIEEACQEFYTECDFRFRGFANRVPTFDITGPADVPFTPRIFSVEDGERLGLLNQNGISVLVAVETEDDVVPVPVELFGNQTFSPTIIKPVRMPGTPSSALAHEEFQGDQLELAKGSCVGVFFRQYQILFPRGRRVRRNRNFVGVRESKCVVFMTAE